MNYWLFVRQFEAHVLGKVEEYELFPLLYQICGSNVQLKISHLSNQYPSTRIVWRGAPFLKNMDICMKLHDVVKNN